MVAAPERELTTFVDFSVSGGDEETVTDVNLSCDSEDITADGVKLTRQGSSVDPPPPPPPPQPAAAALPVGPHLEMEFPSPPRFG